MAHSTVVVWIRSSLWPQRSLHFVDIFYEMPSIKRGEGDGTPLQYSCLENPMDGGAWWAAVHGVVKSQTWLSNFTFTFHFSLSCIEKKMATHSSVLAWRIPGTGEPGGLLSVGSHRVGNDWSDLAVLKEKKKKPQLTYKVCWYSILSSARSELGSIWFFLLFCLPVSFHCPCWWNLTGSQLLKKIRSFNSPRPATQSKRLGRWHRGWETRTYCWAQACISRMTSYLDWRNRAWCFQGTAIAATVGNAQWEVRQVEFGAVGEDRSGRT